MEFLIPSAFLEGICFIGIYPPPISFSVKMNRTRTKEVMGSVHNSTLARVCACAVFSQKT